MSRQPGKKKRSKSHPAPRCKLCGTHHWEWQAHRFEPKGEAKPG